MVAVSRPVRAAEASPYGAGRFASWPLTLKQDPTANVVTVMHEDGTKVAYYQRSWATEPPISAYAPHRSKA